MGLNFNEYSFLRTSAKKQKYVLLYRRGRSIPKEIRKYMISLGFIPIKGSEFIFKGEGIPEEILTSAGILPADPKARANPFKGIVHQGDLCLYVSNEPVPSEIVQAIADSTISDTPFRLPTIV